MRRQSCKRTSQRVYQMHCGQSEQPDRIASFNSNLASLLSDVLKVHGLPSDQASSDPYAKVSATPTVLVPAASNTVASRDIGAGDRHGTGCVPGGVIQVGNDVADIGGTGDSCNLQVVAARGEFRAGGAVLRAQGIDASEQACCWYPGWLCPGWQKWPCPELQRSNRRLKVRTCCPIGWMSFHR